MSIFLVPTGNKELPEAYQNISIDLAGLFQEIKKESPKLYIKELILAMDGIENVWSDFQDWERVILKDKLNYMLNLLKVKPCQE